MGEWLQLIGAAAVGLLLAAVAFGLGARRARSRARSWAQPEAKVATVARVMVEEHTAAEFEELEEAITGDHPAADLAELANLRREKR